jgi:(E)-4-hydroxy-3-methylbut-2-enyl-diphosphate synthase
MNRYGDTPLGMVESALEYVRLCEKNKYYDIILSMKASNPRVMIAAYRLLARRMAEENMDYPFHLGVTEAGDGEDGRIKSAAGIGSLLEDGIGDTIRVSLTEDPEFEIPVAKEIAVRYPLQIKTLDSVRSYPKSSYLDDLFQPARRATDPVAVGPILVGGGSPIRISSRVNLNDTTLPLVLGVLEERVKKDVPPEILEIPFDDDSFPERFRLFREELRKETLRLALAVQFNAGRLPKNFGFHQDVVAYTATPDTWDDIEFARLLSDSKKESFPLILKASNPSLAMTMCQAAANKGIQFIVGLTISGESASVHETRILTAELKSAGIKAPIFLNWGEAPHSLNTAVVFGSLICDGVGDLIQVSDERLTVSSLDFSYNLLQACGNRITKTEFVSCPSCGRTLFDLQTTTERIKKKTGHLKGVKIAIMGCIVNGPGEMADADFGYVGGGPGKINLYIGKNCVEKSIPMEFADDKLIELIKNEGKWIEPQ